MDYQISTQIQGRDVTVQCDESAARVLLPLWSKAEPNLTVCIELKTSLIVVCFIEPYDNWDQCEKCWQPAVKDGLCRKHAKILAA